MTTSVLLVGDSSSRHVERLAAALAERGVDGAVAAFEPSELALPLHRLGRLDARHDRRYALAIPELMRLIRRTRPRVVHAHDLSSYGVLAAAATRLLGSFRLRSHALVQSVWGSDILVTPQRSRRFARLARFGLESADVVTGDSDELRDATTALTRGTVRWHEFIFGPPSALFSTARSDHGMRFISPRALVDAMRIDTVIEAFVEARKAPPLADATLHVCGDGAAGERLRSRFGSASGVTFTGELTTRELHELLGASRSFVSIPRSDGTSASLLEGMARGCVPIVNSLPANLQWVDGSTGVVVGRDPTVGELAAALVRAATDTFDVQAMRAAVRRACWEDQVDGLVQLYDRLGAGPT
jgi:glycosyltransferase involved in cell wall biosynthesis